MYTDSSISLTSITRTTNSICCLCRKYLGNDLTAITTNHPCGCSIHKTCAFELSTISSDYNTVCVGCRSPIERHHYLSSVHIPTAASVSNGNHLIEVSTGAGAVVVNNGCCPRTRDFLFSTRPYFLYFLYGLSIIQIIVGIVGTILTSLSVVTYQFDNSGLTHLVVGFIGGPLVAQITGIPLLIYPKMITVIASILLAPVTIICCIVTTSQFLMSAQFLERYFLSCVDKNSVFYGNSLYYANVAECATLVQTDYCNCYYDAPLYLDLQESPDGKEIPQYGTNACVQVHKNLESCNVIFGNTFKGNSRSGGGLSLYLSIHALILAVACLLSWIFTYCQSGEMNARSRVAMNDDIERMNTRPSLPIARALAVNSNEGPVQVNKSMFGGGSYTSTTENNNNYPNYYDNLRNAKL